MANEEKGSSPSAKGVSSRGKQRHDDVVQIDENRNSEAISERTVQGNMESPGDPPPAMPAVTPQSDEEETEGEVLTEREVAPPQAKLGIGGSSPSSAVFPDELFHEPKRKLQSDQDRFEEMLSLLQRWKKANGSANVPKDLHSDLYKWMKTVKTQHRRVLMHQTSKLTRLRFEQVEAVVGTDWDPLPETEAVASPSASASASSPASTSPSASESTSASTPGAAAAETTDVNGLMTDEDKFMRTLHAMIKEASSAHPHVIDWTEREDGFVLKQVTATSDTFQLTFLAVD